MTKRKKNKIRTDFRKNRVSRQRETDLTRRFQHEVTDAEDDLVQSESVSGKGTLTRRRTGRKGRGSKVGLFKNMPKRPSLG